MPAPLFELSNVHISSLEGVEIVRGVNLVVNKGEVHALVGQNGCGKSTLASAVAGSPEYVITEGTVKLKGDDITNWGPDTRARSGLFLAFQDPQAIPGVSVRDFLQLAVHARTGKDVSAVETYVSLFQWLEALGLDSAFMDRFVNEGLSGEEKKRNEILQMAMLEPEMAILDETDSGENIDALRIVANGVETVRSTLPELGVLAIAHDPRLLDHLLPDKVHIMNEGTIVETGGMELVEVFESTRFDKLIGATT